MLKLISFRNQLTASVSTLLFLVVMISQANYAIILCLLMMFRLTKHFGPFKQVIKVLVELAPEPTLTATSACFHSAIPKAFTLLTQFDVFRGLSSPLSFVISSEHLP